MNIRVLKLAATMAFAISFTFSAHATLIGVQDHGTYLTDTTTGLDWLDVTATANLSYDDVIAQLGSGGAFEGWSYANAAQFGTFVDDTTGIASGINGTGQGYTYSESNTTIRELIGLMGDTLDAFYQHEYGQSYCELNPTSCPNGDQVETRGLLADVDPSASGPYHYAGVLLDDDTYSDSIDVERTSDEYFDNVSSYYFGSFLVRNSVTVSIVPEPPAVMLLVFGLVCLIPLRKSCTFSHGH